MWLCHHFSKLTSLMRIENPRVCVIGAGIAGLTSARYLKDEGINFTVYEATRHVGGTWRYESRVGTDENGLPLYTSMYKHLRTNLPKPVMVLKGFPIPKDVPSYPRWDQYYNYLKAYAAHFGLENYIEFLHQVMSVKRIENIWRVSHRQVVSGETFEDDFDFVFVANGHFSKTNLPDIKGEFKFKGTIIHSHDYREPEAYKGRRVLIVGAGPSGMDISLDVATLCKSLIHSNHAKLFNRTPFPPNYKRKPDVKEFTETGAIFVDGTYEDIDDVIYCTGFQFDFPFLDESSELETTPRSVIPLYRNMVNINQPTMFVLGLVARACLVVALDAQSRFAAAFVKGNFTLPPKEVMLEDLQKRIEVLRSQRRPLSELHLLGMDEDKYYEALSVESGIDRVPPVLFKIRLRDTEARLENLYTYRNYEYTILNNETYSRDLENNLL